MGIFPLLLGDFVAPELSKYYDFMQHAYILSIHINKNLWSVDIFYEILNETFNMTSLWHFITC